MMIIINQYFLDLFFLGVLDLSCLSCLSILSNLSGFSQVIAIYFTKYAN